jgi:hypothetical protein
MKKEIPLSRLISYRAEGYQHPPWSTTGIFSLGANAVKPQLRHIYTFRDTFERTAYYYCEKTRYTSVCSEVGYYITEAVVNSICVDTEAGICKMDIRTSEIVKVIKTSSTVIKLLKGRHTNQQKENTMSKIPLQDYLAVRKHLPKDIIGFEPELPAPYQDYKVVTEGEIMKGDVLIYPSGTVEPAKGLIGSIVKEEDHTVVIRPPAEKEEVRHEFEWKNGVWMIASHVGWLTPPACLFLKGFKHFEYEAFMPSRKSHEPYLLIEKGGVRIISPSEPKGLMVDYEIDNYQIILPSAAVLEVAK